MALSNPYCPAKATQQSSLEFEHNPPTSHNTSSRSRKVAAQSPSTVPLSLDRCHPFAIARLQFQREQQRHPFYDYKQNAP